MIPAGIISADGHVCEPANCYVDYIDPQYRDQAPHIESLVHGLPAIERPASSRPVSFETIGTSRGGLTTSIDVTSTST